MTNAARIKFYFKYTKRIRYPDHVVVALRNGVSFSRTNIEDEDGYMSWKTGVVIFPW